MKRGAVLALITLAIVALCAVGVRAMPVLFRFKDPSSVDPSDGLVVLFNPVRNRAPEQPADALLRHLRSGKCETALAFVEPERRRDYCERERNHRVATWALRDREDEHGESRLFFSVSRAPGLYQSNVWITVRSIRGQWQPVEFECWY